MKQSKLEKQIRTYSLFEMKATLPYMKTRNMCIFFDDEAKKKYVCKKYPTYQALMGLYYNEKCKPHNKRNFLTGVYIQTSPCKVTGNIEWREMYTFRQRIDTSIEVLSYKTERRFSDPCDPMAIPKMTEEFRVKTGIEQRARRAKIIERNIADIRLLLNGPSAPKIVSNVDHDVLESIEFTLHMTDRITANIFRLHHIKVVNGTSYTKSHIDPSVMILSSDIRERPGAIVELMGTIAVSPTDHDLIHRYKNSGLSNYKKHQWPWCLRTEDNFEYVKRMYKLDDIEYYSFIANLGAEIT